MGHNLHGVSLEEVLKLLLSGRVGKVADVQATTLISTGGSSISGLRSRRSTVGVGGVVNVGRSQGVGKGVDGRHLEGGVESRVRFEGRWFEARTVMCQTN